MPNAQIGTITHLSAMPKSHLALSLLQRIASRVASIMTAHAFRVPSLTEFYPSQANLLGINVNKGSKISLRLRSPHNPSDFLEYESVLETMVHELCHCVHGPHDARFYALLDQLMLEMHQTEEGARVPYAGAGVTLGGTSRGVKRTRKGTQVGGTLVSREELKRRVADAAVRRAHDAKWCGAGRAENPILLDEERDAAAEVNDAKLIAGLQMNRQDVSDHGGQELRQKPVQNDEDISNVQHSDQVIEITSDEEDTIPQKIHKVQKQSQVEEQERKDYMRMKQRGLLRDTLEEHLQKSSSLLKAKRRIQDSTGFWICPICTLRNILSAELCEACGTDRPAETLSREDYWHCQTCQLFNLKSRWMCTGCQSIKTSS